MPAPRHWTGTPMVLNILQQLEALSVRLARLEALRQAQQTTAVVLALHAEKTKT